mmetsp:Transcript_40928/g.130827  ORF Transcript_40928/g.130827 Transcript_40928/m.130827 type:complete len:206 (-) Transcript_40928:356-973(-)
MLVPLFGCSDHSDSLVEVLVPHGGVLVVEVGPHLEHDITPSVNAGLLLDLLDEGSHPLLHIVPVQARVVLDRRVVAQDVEIEPGRRAVVARVGHAGENLRTLAQGRRCAPHELEVLLRGALFHILVVDAAKEEPVKACLDRQEGRLGGRVAEGVELPPDTRRLSEKPLDEAMPERRLVDHRLVVRCGLIVHAPAAVDELKLPLGN